MVGQTVWCQGLAIITTFLFNGFRRVYFAMLSYNNRYYISKVDSPYENMTFSL